jgi:hypothetical protein
MATARGAPVRSASAWITVDLAEDRVLKTKCDPRGIPQGPHAPPVVTALLPTRPIEPNLF